MQAHQVWDADSLEQVQPGWEADRREGSLAFGISLCADFRFEDFR